MRTRSTIAATAALVAFATSAHAVQYLTIEGAQALLFPSAAEFRSAELLLTDAQRQTISDASGVRVRNAHIRCWSVHDAQGSLLGRVFLDEVTGKHDLITYALGVAADGRIVGIEILDYRENYGGQIRNAAWRAQFHGKTARDPLKVDFDIQNISGATLSSSHVTDGVRRLLALDELVLNLAPR